MKEHEMKSKVRENFGANAEKYVASASHASGADLATLVEWLQPAEDWSVLDVATGGGHVAIVLAPHVRHVFATDLTRQMLAAARKHVSDRCDNVTYIVADAEDLPFLDESFDAVVCRIAAHHFPNPHSFIRETARVLKPNGKFILIDNVSPDDSTLDRFVNAMEKLRDDSHVRCYRVSEWTEWFEESGLIIQASEPKKKTFDFPVWVRRTARSEEQVQLVIRHILGSEQATKNYYAVVEEGSTIRSLQVDEWMVMAYKGCS